MHEWDRWSTRNCARDQTLNILNGIITNQNPSKKWETLNSLGLWSTDESPNSD